MLVLNENMYWTYFFVFMSVHTFINCENLRNDDEYENDQVMLEGRKVNNHNQHSVQQNYYRFISDEPSNAESIPFDADDRKYVHRRTNFRRRKMGSSNHKKSVYRRGQRRRHNKNGKSIRQDSKSIFFFTSLPQLITQSMQ